MQHPLPEIQQAHLQLFEAIKAVSRRGQAQGPEPVDLDENMCQAIIGQIVIWRESYPMLNTYPNKPEVRPLDEALEILQQPHPLTYWQVQRAHDLLISITTLWDEDLRMEL